MLISPIVPIAPISINATQQVTNPTTVGGGDSFSSTLANQLDKLSAAQGKADSLAVQAATGDLASIQDYTIASTEAQLMTQLTVAVRNKAVEAFNDIMRMQV
jgi:flagellar hook-basal body complex protein FliE